MFTNMVDMFTSFFLQMQVEQNADKMRIIVLINCLEQLSEPLLPPRPCHGKCILWLPEAASLGHGLSRKERVRGDHRALCNALLPLNVCSGTGNQRMR